MSDEHKPIDNVVSLPTPAAELRRKDDVPFELVVNNSGRFCAHGRRTVDRNLRAVSCSLCGAPLDPFDVLLEVATEHQRFAYSLKSLQTDIKAADGRLALLKRLEDNTRARAKRIGIKGSRSHFDDLLAYARERQKPTSGAVTAEELERQIDARDPLVLLRTAVLALEKGATGAAVELGRRSIDELEAALQVVDEERDRRHA